MLKPLRGLLIGMILTAVFLWPILNKTSDHLYSRQDGILVAWLINWGSQSLATGQNFFNAPFFHPYQNTIGYSDLFLPTAIFNLPLILFGSNNIIFNQNLHLIAGSVVIFFGHYLLAKEVFKKQNLAILSATIFSFTHVHLDYMAHLHVFLLAGLPFGTYFLLRFEKTGRTRYLLGLALACLYQFLNSVMSGYFLTIILAIFIVFKSELRKKLFSNSRKIFPLLVGSLLLVGFFYWPYFQIKNQFEFTRTIRDAAHFAFGIEKFFEAEMIFLVALITSLLFTLKKNKKQNWLPIFLTITLTGLILMLGPALKIFGQTIKIFHLPIPLPYGLAFYLIPGFQAFRASSRFIILFGFGSSLLIPYLLENNKYFANLNKKVQNKVGWTIAALMIISLWLMRLPKQKIFYANPQTPSIYEVVKNRPEKVLAEFPTYVWSQTSDYFHEADRLLYQAYHQKKLYNGFSGFAPPERENLWHTLSHQLNTPDAIAHLKKSGVELVLLHQKEEDEYLNFYSENYELIACLDQDCLYHLK